jgi:tetratricopeptide (TPR) repeat protein
LQNNPSNVDALYRRSPVLRRLGHFHRAEDDRAHAIQLVDAKLQESPANIVALRQRAMLHFAANHWPETIADGTRVLKSRPKDTAILHRRATAAAHLGDWKQVQQDNERILALSPTDAYRLNQRCRASLELGQTEEVARDVLRLRELVGQNAALANTAGLWFLDDDDIGRFPEEVIWFAQRAVELDPRAECRITLGGIYYRLGRCHEAVDTLATATGEASGSTAALGGFLLAMSRYQQGDHEKGHEDYRRALRIWKWAGHIAPAREDLLQKVWQEAKSLLFGGSENAASRS